MILCFEMGLARKFEMVHVDPFSPGAFRNLTTLLTDNGIFPNMLTLDG